MKTMKQMKLWMESGIQGRCRCLRSAVSGDLTSIGNCELIKKSPQGLRRFLFLGNLS